MAAKAEMGAWTSFFFGLIAKYKDGQRVEDPNAETLKPTSLFYPRWWLTEVGFFDQGKIAEQESTVQNTGWMPAMLSHAAVAAVSGNSTQVYLSLSL